MKLVLLILGIVLAVVLGLVALILLLLVPRTGVHIDACNTHTNEEDMPQQQIKIAVQYGWLRKRVFTLPKPDNGKPPKPQKPKKPKKPKKDTDADEPKPKPDRMAQLGAVLSLLYDLHHCLVLDKIWLEMTVASGNAATTGQLFGGANAMAGTLTAFLQEHFTIERYHINIDVDFTEKAHTYDPNPCTRYQFETMLRIRPLYLILVVLWHWKKYMPLLGK